jgi:small subunit ribosomal protein S17e
LVPSKRMRNKIAGFATHLLRRIERGDNVRGISLKLQEEERERRMDFIPAESAINVNQLTVDPDTKDMISSLGLIGAVPLTVQDPKRQEERRENRGGDRRREQRA